MVTLVLEIQLLKKMLKEMLQRTSNIYCSKGICKPKMPKSSEPFPASDHEIQSNTNKSSQGIFQAIIIICSTFILANIYFSFLFFQFSQQKWNTSSARVYSSRIRGSISSTFRARQFWISPTCGLPRTECS
jgi:hypothetical protein